MKKMLAKQKVHQGKITDLGTKMLSIAEITLNEIERLHIDKYIWKVRDNVKTIRFLAFILGRI